MRRVAKLVGYTVAFTFVLPQISIALIHGELRTTILWYAFFILIVEGSAILFDFLLTNYNSSRTRKTD